MSTPSSWNSYPKIWNLGHPQAKELFLGEVTIEEKIDGSQFSFGVFDGELKIKSKGANIDPDAPPTMFKGAVETVQRLKNGLVPGWTYRGEVLSRPKHNVLAYDRIPSGQIILFDVTTEYETYAPSDQVAEIAKILGLESVPIFYTGVVSSIDTLRHLMDHVSCLGGQKIEGIVIKNRTRFGIDGKPLMGKLVSESFKEVHKGEWRAANPTKGDIIEAIADKLTTPARWHKAVQHLREAGKLTDTPKDIGPLLIEIARDTQEEEEVRIKDALFNYAWKDIRRKITHGFPEWYKEQLLGQQQFPGNPEIIDAPEGTNAE